REPPTSRLLPYTTLFRSTLQATLGSPKRTANEHRLIEKYGPTMDYLSQVAEQTYRDLVFNTPGFTEYFFTATPILEISDLKIGSDRKSTRLNSSHVSISY